MEFEGLNENINKKTQNPKFHVDDVFSVGTGLEHAAIVGPVHCLLTSGSFAKSRNKKDQRGLARCLSDA